MVGHYLGDPANPCITIIDTPGTSDTEGRDCEHGVALAEGIKRIASITAFMMLFNGERPRFTQSTQEQVKLYENIFGREMWKNTITEFTFWQHDQRRIDERLENRELDEDIQHKRWNKEYENRFGVTQTVPSVFVDPVFKERYADENEKEINKENTDKLWNLLTKSLTNFGCDNRCKAPSGFFAGQPWLTEGNSLQNKRLQERVVVTWQIWFAGCDGSGTKSYTISHVNADNVTTLVYSHQVYHHNEWKDESKLMKGMTVLDEPTEKFKTIRMFIESTDDEHFGSYFVENDKGRSELGQLNKIVDGEWQEWSSFGPCSKTCITGSEAPGVMERTRVCKPPQNGGLPCKGPNKDEKTCAHQPSDAKDIFRCKTMTIPKYQIPLVAFQAVPS